MSSNDEYRYSFCDNILFPIHMALACSALVGVTKKGYDKDINLCSFFVSYFFLGGI